MPIVYEKSLNRLRRMRSRWENAIVKDESQRTAAIGRIDKAIAERTQRRPLRCALPKKKQRELGILPPVTATHHAWFNGQYLGEITNLEIQPA